MLKSSPKVSVTPSSLGRRRSSALSLNSLQKKATKEKETPKEIDLSKMPKEDFSKADFQVYWKKYVTILNKQGEKMLGSILNSTEPSLVERKVSLEFPNEMMRNEVKKNQAHILNYLRGKLKNYDIELECILNETIEKEFVYTPEERYKKLRETNKLIEDLRKTLFLDI